MALRTTRSNAALRPVVTKSTMAEQPRTRKALSSITNKSESAVVPSTKKDVTAKELAGKAVSKPVANLRNQILVAQAHRVATRGYTKSKLKAKDEPNVPKTQPVDEVPMEICEPEIKAFSERIIPDNVLDIDKDGLENLFLCGDFGADIYDYLRQLEVKYAIEPDFLSIQTDVTSKMRGILIDWLIQVHQKFHLLIETLFLTVTILDRYLSIKNVPRSELQLVGVTAMLIASKYEEMYAPEVTDFVYVTDNAYSKKQVLKMEVQMLSAINFQLGKPLPIHFLRRCSRAGQCDIMAHNVSKYLMELSLAHIDFACIPPSLLAASALYLSLKVIEDSSWNSPLVYYSGYEEVDIYPVAQKLSDILVKAPASKFQSVRTKYASSKMLKVSCLPALDSDIVHRIAKN